MLFYASTLGLYAVYIGACIGVSKQNGGNIRGLLGHFSLIYSECTGLYRVQGCCSNEGKPNGQVMDMKWKMVDPIKRGLYRV